jgi:hypothetical protein
MARVSCGDPILTIRVVPPPIEASAQVKVTRVTVTDRQTPPEPAPYGTQLARRLLSLNLGRHALDEPRSEQVSEERGGIIWSGEC